MSAVTKKHLTKLDVKKRPHKTIFHLAHKGRIYNIPKNVAEKYEDKKNSSDSVLPEEIFASIEKKYSKPGVLLKGLRYREGLTQLEMAKKLKVTQADLSKMENGKRPIGKIIAKRIEKEFRVHYRYFL